MSFSIILKSVNKFKKDPETKSQPMIYVYWSLILIHGLVKGVLNLKYVFSSIF